MSSKYINERYVFKGTSQWIHFWINYLALVLHNTFCFQLKYNFTDAKNELKGSERRNTDFGTECKLENNLLPSDQGIV